jgi:hypothetical protein
MDGGIPKKVYVVAEWDLYGIEEFMAGPNVTISKNSVMVRRTIEKVPKVETYKIGETAFFTRIEAVAYCERQRREVVNQFKKELARLESLIFKKDESKDAKAGHD